MVKRSPRGKRWNNLCCHICSASTQNTLSPVPESASTTVLELDPESASTTVLELDSNLVQKHFHQLHFLSTFP